MAITQDVTPWSTVTPYASAYPNWISEFDRERIQAYMVYQNMYFSEEGTFDIIRRAADGRAVLVPKPRVVCDTTNHYFLKGMEVVVPSGNAQLIAEIDRFIKRERFYSKFKTAKLAGVIRGDFLFHFTGNPNKPQGSRISFNSVDPASYFPEFDTDDAEKRTGCKLIAQVQHPDDPEKVVLQILRYWINYDPDGNRIDDFVWREENLWEMEGWNNPARAKKVRAIIPPSPLPGQITQIPIYHFKNSSFDGFDFGNSELKGLERAFQAIDQAISDEDIALALVGLGVYATDAGRPKDSQGREVDWVVAPGMVWEMPGATMVKRLEGITTVQPVLDHVAYLEDSVFQASGTTKVALGTVEVSEAESGVALALRFEPTLAKIEERDTAGVEMLTQMWYDWKFWLLAYEAIDYTTVDIEIKLGDKLPTNRKTVIDELNNLLDRKVISRQYYRDELKKRLGFEFPADIEQQMMDEQVALAESMMQLQQKYAPEPDQQDGGGRPQGAGDTRSRRDRNRSNNRGRVNESNGTESR